MKFFKDLIGIKSEDDNIPQIILQKNEPKVYYDPIKKRYIIEGEKYEETKKSSGPPKHTKTFDKSEKPKTQGLGPPSARRYINILGEENILKTPEPKNNQFQLDDNDEEEKVKEAKLKEIEIELEMEREREKVNEKQRYPNENDIDKELQDNDQDKKDKDIHIEDSESKKERDKDQFENEVQMSEIEHKEDAESSFAVRDLYYQHAEIEKIKSEAKLKMMEMQTEYQEEIRQLRESIQFYEEDNEESTQLLKNQITNFINENLELKMNYEKSKDELVFKQKEIEEYQKLFEYYRRLVDENTISKQDTPKDDLAKQSKTMSKDNSNNQLGSDYVYINSKIEKLETEKIILNNDLIELKSENESIKLEKEYLIKKTAALEGQNNKIKADQQQIESSFQELHSNNKSLNHIREELEKKISLLNEEANSNNTVISDKKHLIVSLQKNLEDSNRKITQLTTQNNSTQEKNDKLNKELRKISKHYNQTVDDYSKEMALLKNQIEADRENYKKTIESVTIEKDNLIRELDDCLMQINQQSNADEIGQIEELKYKNRQLEKSFEEGKEQIERIKAFINQQKISHPNMADLLKISNVNDLSNTTFDKEMCNIILNMITLNSKMSNCIKEIKLNDSIAKTENANLLLEIKLLKTKMAQDAQKSHKLLYKTINDSNQAISSLKSINSRLVPKSFKDDCYLLSNQLNELKQKNSSIVKENEELKSKVLTLMQMLQEEKEQYEENLQKEQATFSNERIELQNKLKEIEQKYQFCNNQITDKENDIQQVNKEKLELTDQYKKSASESSVMKAKITELMEILSSMQEESESDVQLQSVLKTEYEGTIAELSKSLDEMTVKLNEEKAMKEYYEKGIKELYDEIERLKKLNKQHEEDNQLIKKDYQSITSAYSMAKEEILKKEKEKENLMEEQSDIMSKMEKDNQSLEQKLAEMMKLLKEYDKETKDNYTSTDNEEKIPEKEKKDKSIQWEGENEMSNNIDQFMEKNEINKSIVNEIQENEEKEKKNKEEAQSTQSQSQKLGFLGRLMAPLFLTEKEYETINK